jgi:hypothetical protein
VIVADMLIQLCICFICFTMGSGFKLRRRNRIVFEEKIEEKSLEDSGVALNLHEGEQLEDSEFEIILRS